MVLRYGGLVRDSRMCLKSDSVEKRSSMLKYDCDHSRISGLRDNGKVSEADTGVFPSVLTPHDSISF